MSHVLRIPPSLALAVVVVWTSACSAEQLGFPRTPVSASSPDGRHLAFVRNHPNPDPPSQTIWLGHHGERSRQIQELGPDSDWCNRIVWSDDSSTVAYLVQDARLITVDAATDRIVSEIWLAPNDSYPPQRMVVDLSLNATGSEARFRTCRRNLNRPGYVHEPTDCGVTQSVRVKPS